MTANIEMGGVVCKSRAKRGFATDPRSIAERVRDHTLIFDLSITGLVLIQIAILICKI